MPSNSKAWLVAGLFDLIAVASSVAAETHESENAIRNVTAEAIYTPRPEYPGVGVGWGRVTGSGAAVLKIEQKTGLVRDAYMETSTGHTILIMPL